MKTKSQKTTTEPCFECDDGILEVKLLDYNSQHPQLGEFTVSKVPMLVCNCCGDTLLGEEGNTKIDHYLDKALNAISPEELQGFLSKYGLTQKEASKLTGYGEKNISRWLTGRSRPSESVSNFFRMVLNSEEAFSLLQSKNWNSKAIQFPAEHRQPTKEEKLVLKLVDYKVLSDLGVVAATTKFDEKRTEICRASKCEDLLKFRQQTESEVEKIAAFKDCNKSATLVGCGLWISLGERAAHKVITAPYDREKLSRAIDSLKELTQHPLETVVTEVKSKLADAGVALVFVPAIKGSSLRGCTRLLSPTKAMVLHGLKYRNVAQFWIVLFHELAHLLLHIETSKDVFAEYENQSDDPRELVANQWAYDKLVSLDKELEFKANTPKPKPVDVERFARSIKVHTAVVAEVYNRRANREVIKYAELNSGERKLFPHLSKDLVKLLVESSDFK